MLNSCDMSEKMGKKMGPNLDMWFAEVRKKPYVYIYIDTLHIDNRNYI